VEIHNEMRRKESEAVLAVNQSTAKEEEMTFKHLLTSSLIVLCVGFSPIWADDPVATPVETFLQAARDFAGTLDDVAGFDDAAKTAYLNAINTIQTSVTTLPTTTTYDAATYFGVVNTKWTEMMAAFATSSHPYTTNMKSEYAAQVANYIKGDCRAVINEWEYTDCADYYGLLNDTYTTRLNTAVSTATTTRHNFNPYSSLDEGVPGVTKDPVGLHAYTAGMEEQWSSYNIREAVGAIRNRYSYDAQLKADLDWFLTVWPSSSELLATELNSNGQYLKLNQGNSYAGNGGHEIQIINANYTIDEYGKPSDTTMPNTNLTNYPLTDKAYTDRKYGYRSDLGTGYNTGTYKIPTVSIQVGDRVYQLYDSLTISPIVLDLDGDGNLEASNGNWLPHPYNNTRLVEFDINGDEFLELTEWVGASDGLLLVSGNTSAINANSLFGEAGGFSDGFEKLSLWDKNGDKQLTGEELSQLSVWQDKNINARVDDGEVSSVTTLGITAISLAHTELVSTFVQNGVTKRMWDWYPVAFRVKRTK